MGCRGHEREDGARPSRNQIAGRLPPVERRQPQAATELEEQRAEIAADRRSQVGTGERSEKVRTYNYPQGRVTDHRIKLTAHNLDEVLGGDLSEFTSALAAEEKHVRLEEQTAAEPGRR